MLLDDIKDWFKDRYALHHMMQINVDETFHIGKKQILTVRITYQWPLFVDEHKQSDHQFIIHMTQKDWHHRVADYVSGIKLDLINGKLAIYDPNGHIRLSGTTANKIFYSHQQPLIYQQLGWQYYKFRNMHRLCTLAPEKIEYKLRLMQMTAWNPEPIEICLH